MLHTLNFINTKNMLSVTKTTFKIYLPKDMSKYLRSHLILLCQMSKNQWPNEKNFNKFVANVIMSSKPSYLRKNPIYNYF